MYEGSGNVLATTDRSFNQTTSFQVFTRNAFDDEAWNNYKSCWDWTTPRILVEFYVFFVLLENLYLVYVVVVSFKKSERTFFGSCVLVTAFSGIALMLIVLLFPLVFPWRDKQDFTVESPGDWKTNGNSFRNNATLLLKFTEESEDHHCQQSGGQLCRGVGWVLSLAVYVPFVSNTMICLNTSMAAFCWKMYKLKVHTISSIRLIVFLCMILAVVISFGLPAVEAGAHYHYNTFLKLCWLPLHLENNMETRFVFFAFGFLSFIMFVLMAFFYLLVQAHRSEVSYNQTTGNRCSIIYGVVIMKTKFWTLHSRAAIWIALATVVLYFPLTVGIILRFTIITPCKELLWFDIIIYASMLLPPAVIPIINLTQFKPYRQAAEDTFSGCNKPIKKNRVSPLSFEMCSVDSDDMPSGNGNDTWNNTGRSFIVERYRGYPKYARQGPTTEAGQYRKPLPRATIEESDSGYQGTMQRNYLYSTAESHGNYGYQWQDQRHAAAYHPVRVPRQELYDPYTSYDRRPPPTTRYDDRTRKNVVSRGRQPFYRGEGSIPKLVQRYWRNISSSRRSRRRARLSPARDDPESPRGQQRPTGKRNVTFGPTPTHSPLARNPSLPRPGAVKRRVQKFMAQSNFASPFSERRPAAPSRPVAAAPSDRHVGHRRDAAQFHGNYGHLYPPTLSRPTGDKLSDESQTSLRGDRPNDWEVFRDDPIPDGRYIYQSRRYYE